LERDVTLEALEPGTVVLNAQGRASSHRRVFNIDGGAAVKLIGLNITGGYVSSWSPSSIGGEGGGLRVGSDSEAILERCHLYMKVPPLHEHSPTWLRDSRR
jgi:hypothetical protein